MFPLLVVMLIHGVGWRLSWVILGIVILIVLLPAISLLLRTGKGGPNTPIEKKLPASRNFTLLSDGRFYALLPGNLFLPLVLTALFLYQIPLAEEHGWSIEIMATAFIGFAVGRMAGSLLIGPWIDRYDAIYLFPFILIPACAGLVILSLGSATWIAFAYLTLAGVSQGIAGPTMTALWAEIYGVESLGATKGTVATIGVFATALGPVLLGSLLKVGVPFSLIVPSCAGLGLLTVGVGLLVRWRLIGEMLAEDEDLKQASPFPIYKKQGGYLDG